MKLFGWKNNHFKFFGLTVLRFKNQKEKLVFRFAGIPVFSKKTELSKIEWLIKNNKDFDTRAFDVQISGFCPNVKHTKSFVNKKRVAYLATELYDFGGHSKCVREQIRCLKDLYEQHVFLTKISSSACARSTMKELSETSCVSGSDMILVSWRKKVADMFDGIAQFNPAVLFVFIHPDDIFGTMILSLLKKHTDIKIIYCPHASHFPNLGLTFADATLEALPVTAYITQKYRHFNKTILIPMLSKKKGEFPVFSAEQIAAKRKEIGLSENDLCTMSGASAYKFFDGNISEYFQTIKNLLDNHKNVKHVILSRFNKAQQKIIDDIFAGSEAKARLIVLPFSNEYELFFKCADVFIDSFPVSSALTMIDLMRLKVPYVVKINCENAHRSFHEYQMTDYPYMFKKTDDLLKGVETLLADKQECARIIEMNYRHYLEMFEGNTVKKHLCEIIDNADHLERFYTGPINGNYQFKELGL